MADNNDEQLQNAYNAAKDFASIDRIYMAISLHPEWLTIIPHNRKWTILHQVVLSGNVDTLNRLIATQKNYTKFRLGDVKTKEGETVLDIAKQRLADKPEMLARIQRLLDLDEMLGCAKDGDWEACYAIVEKHPDYANQKPPNRRYYLIHHLVCADAIDEFHQFQKIKNCKFDLHLLADEKNIYTIANEEEVKSYGFIKYIEENESSLMDEADDVLVASKQTEDKTIEMSNVLQQNIVLSELDHLMDAPRPTRQETRGAYEMTVANLKEKQEQRHVRTNQARATSSTQNNDISVLNLIDNLICPLTKGVFNDPVVAADGITYEREAIEDWLKRSSKSPKTNEKLAHKQLNPNLAIFAILCAIYGKK